MHFSGTAISGCPLIEDSNALRPRLSSRAQPRNLLFVYPASLRKNPAIPRHSKRSAVHLHNDRLFLRRASVRLSMYTKTLGASPRPPRLHLQRIARSRFSPHHLFANHRGGYRSRSGPVQPSIACDQKREQNTYASRNHIGSLYTAQIHAQPAARTANHMENHRCEQDTHPRYQKRVPVQQGKIMIGDEDSEQPRKHSVGIFDQDAIRLLPRQRG
jgi:hypothetical protein